MILGRRQTVSLKLIVSIILIACGGNKDFFVDNLRRRSL